jgi:ABC-2 type transport system permease protein
MSELAPNPTRWTTTQTRAQFLAIAWLRWRILANGFRRKGGTGELVARILIYPIFAGMAFGPSVLAAIGGYYFTSQHQLAHISWLCWGIFILCQLLNINLGSPGTTFDPTQLIRFPMRLPNYVAVRLAFGLLTPANVIGTLMCLCVALGITIAEPGLWLYALIGLSVFAAVNVLFSRMVFSWVDRWLSTRRAREIFTGVIFVFSLGIQFLNFAFNPAYNRHGQNHSHISPEHIAQLTNLYHRAQPYAHWLPPGLTAGSLIAAHNGLITIFLELTAACALYAAAFLAIFALRMSTEFRGESLSDVANSAPRTKSSTKSTLSRGGPPVPLHGTGGLAATAASPTPARSYLGISPIVQAMFAKELLFVRRNMGLFYGLIAPIVFVFLFAGRMATRSQSGWVFPAAVAYSLLGITPLAYNSFGLEGPGAQLYFIAPIRIRDIIFAKNLMNLLMTAIEIAAVYAIISYVAVRPTVQSVAIAVLWVTGTLLLNTTVGNRRSITSPKKVNPARTTNKQVSPLSSLIGMGIFLAAGIVGGGLLAGALYLHKDWLLLPIFGLYAAVGLFIYLRGLTTIDTFAYQRREDLLLELCKGT